MSVFRECYTFIQLHYNKPYRLWKSVRRELYIYKGILPLIWLQQSPPLMLHVGVWELQHPSSVHQKYSMWGGILKDGGFLTATSRTPEQVRWGAADCGSQQAGAAAKVVGEKAKSETFDPIGFDTAQKS